MVEQQRLDLGDSPQCGMRESHTKSPSAHVFAVLRWDEGFDLSPIIAVIAINADFGEKR